MALAIFIILARILGPATFGLFAMALVIVGLAEQTVAEGLAEGLVQRETIEDGHIDAAFWGIIGFAVVVSLIAVGLAHPVALAFGEPRVEALIYWLTPIILLTALGTIPSVILQRRFAFRALAVRTTGSVAVGGVVGLAMAFSGYGIWSLVGHQVAMRLAAIAVVWWSVPWRPGLRGTRRHFQDLWKFALNMLILRSLSMVHQRLVIFLIGVHLGAEAVGFFNLAIRCSDVLTAVFVMPATRVAFPLFSRVRVEPARMRRAFATFIRLVPLVSAPAFAGAALVGPDLVPVVFGAEWSPAVWVFVIYISNGILVAPHMVSSAAVRSAGKPHWLSIATGCWAAGTLAAVLAFGSFGIVWPAAILVIGTALTLPVHLVFIRKITGLTAIEVGREIAPTVGGLLVMAAAVLAWRHIVPAAMGDAYVLASSVAVGAGTYILWHIVVNRDEMLHLREHFRSLRSPAGNAE